MMQAKSVARALSVILNCCGADVCTVPLERFLRLVGQIAPSSAFDRDLKLELAEHGVIIALGRNSVVLARDANFRPADELLDNVLDRFRGAQDSGVRQLRLVSAA